MLKLTMTEHNFADPQSARAKVPTTLRIVATLLRTAFIVLFGVLTLRVSIPERETIFSASVRWDDLVRMALGLAVCGWLVVHLFKGGPRGIKGYKTWFYLGLVAVPFMLICLVAIW
jgi:uncharacterized membrane protein YhdT